MTSSAFICTGPSLRTQCVTCATLSRSLRHKISIAKRSSPVITSRSFAAQTASLCKQEESAVESTPSISHRSAISHTAKRRQSDKEFFVDLLNSASTKRDAKTYINWLKEPVSRGQERGQTSQGETTSTTVPRYPLAGRIRAADESPTFKQYVDSREPKLATSETIHLALVKIRNVGLISTEVLEGIARTLSQLSRLSISPCVVLEEIGLHDFPTWRKHINEQVERLISAIERVGDTSARKLDNLLTLSSDGHLQILSTNLLSRALRDNRIPIIPPIAYDETQHKALPVSADASIVALARHFANASRSAAEVSEQSSVEARSIAVTLERIIVIDETGGIPNTKSSDKMHLFVNLAQEYSAMQEELRSSSAKRISSRHASNLKLMRDVLRLLPHTTSGLITSPINAANMNRSDTKGGVSSVGTRRQKNPLIHNLLTDKPIYSSSLPTGRLASDQVSTATLASTFVKLGMPLTLLPEPAAQPWRANSKPRLKLTDPRIDLRRLVYLIDDSFGRSLDVDAYLKRVNDRIAGVIIAGDYEGGAILTWETPLGVEDHDTARLVPYLDKFAVLKKAQGAGGVADIVFNAMVRSCFPDGVCWRSRKDNPVNKWYFERSRGTWKIPDMNWTMFWTTPNLAVPGSKAGSRMTINDDQNMDGYARLFHDYEAVCRSVQPTWADGKKILD